MSVNVDLPSDPELYGNDYGSQIVQDGNGNLYFIAIRPNDRIDAWKSTDQGASWSIVATSSDFYDGGMHGVSFSFSQDRIAFCHTDDFVDRIGDYAWLYNISLYVFYMSSSSLNPDTFMSRFKLTDILSSRMDNAIIVKPDNDMVLYYSENDGGPYAICRPAYRPIVNDILGNQVKPNLPAGEPEIFIQGGVADAAGNVFLVWKPYDTFATSWVVLNNSFNPGPIRTCDLVVYSINDTQYMGDWRTATLGGQTLVYDAYHDSIFCLTSGSGWGLIGSAQHSEMANLSWRPVAIDGEPYLQAWSMTHPPDNPVQDLPGPFVLVKLLDPLTLSSVMPTAEQVWADHPDDNLSLFLGTTGPWYYNDHLYLLVSQWGDNVTHDHIQSFDPFAVGPARTTTRLVSVSPAVIGVNRLAVPFEDNRQTWNSQQEDWVDQVGADTLLWARLDEMEPDNDDYIQSRAGPTGQIYRAHLTPITAPPNLNYIYLRYSYWRDSHPMMSGKAYNLKVRLVQCDNYGPTNWATPANGAVASASSRGHGFIGWAFPSPEPSVIIDGNDTTCNWGDPEYDGAAGNGWKKLDLGTPRRVTAIRVKQGDLPVVSYDVLTSNDGVTYNPLLTRNPAPADETYTIPPTVARYWMIRNRGTVFSDSGFAPHDWGVYTWELRTTGLNGYKIIGEWTHLDIQNTDPQLVQQELTLEQAQSITDWNKLNIEFEAYMT